jgi:hypothetical protein
MRSQHMRHSLHCALAFDTSDPEFIRGFEAGRLWALAQMQPDEEVEDYAHATNAEMVLRIAEATDRSAKSSELGEGWLLIALGMAGTAGSEEP